MPVRVVDREENSTKKRDGHSLHSPNNSLQQSPRLLFCLARCAHVYAKLRVSLGVYILSVCDWVSVKSHGLHLCPDGEKHPTG